MMEAYEGLSPEAIMNIPSTRRYRLMQKKSELEERRRQKMDSEMARSRARSHRR
jgi:hypothetical protein